MHRDFFNTDPRSLGGCCAESPGNNYYSMFRNAVCDLVVEKLQITWSDRGVFRNVLISAIDDEFKRYSEQYLHSQLEILARSVTQALGLSEELKPDYNHATHAKFATIMETFRKHNRITNEIIEELRIFGGLTEIRDQIKEIVANAEEMSTNSVNSVEVNDIWLGKIVSELFPEHESGTVICLDDILDNIRKLKDAARIPKMPPSRIELCVTTEQTE